MQARSSADLTGAYQEADHLLLELHGITDPTDADFTITSQASLIAANTSVDHTLTILLGGIAGISLIVGGIGVMNIMLVSVTERIREIGLRKALGATPRVIRRQFLVEASVLGLIGGILGVLAGSARGPVPARLDRGPDLDEPDGRRWRSGDRAGHRRALRGLPGQPGGHHGPHRRPPQRLNDDTITRRPSHPHADNRTQQSDEEWKEEARSMQSATSLGQRHTQWQHHRRWTRIIGTGTTAWWPPPLSARGRRGDGATGRPEPRRERQRGGARRQRSNMEVQNASSGQTTVNWTSTTTFSKTVTEAVSALAAGDCVSVTGTPSKKSKTTIAARSITVTTAARVVRARARRSARGPVRRAKAGASGSEAGAEAVRAVPASAGQVAKAEARSPVAAHQGARPTSVRNSASWRSASGKVTVGQGIDAHRLWLHREPRSVHPGATKSGSKSTKKPTTPQDEKSLTITTSKSTTVSSTQSAAATALAVGDCVSAFGRRPATAP